MNILFFLTPKSEVACICETDTVRQALEKMEHHSYTAVPLLSKDGRYIGTLTEGDLLWNLKKEDFPDLKALEEIPVGKLKRGRDNTAIRVSVSMEALLDRITRQNFVPVVDDQNVFIGIVTRQALITYLRKELEEAGAAVS